MHDRLMEKEKKEKVNLEKPLENEALSGFRLTYLPAENKTDFVDPTKLFQSMALRLESYDMYEHAKRFEASKIDAMMAQDV